MIKDTSERVGQLREAQGMIEEAIFQIEDALSGTSQESHAKAYLIAHLRTWVGEGSSYDTSIPDYIEALEKGE